MLDREYKENPDSMQTSLEALGTVDIILGLGKPVLLPMSVDLKKTIKFHCQNQLDLSGLILLAAFPKHSGNLYEQSGALMKLWPAWSWLYVAVQHHGIE